MEALTNFAYARLDEGSIPDFLVRRAIRHLCNARLTEIASTSMEAAVEAKWDYIEKLKVGEVAIETEKANEQHYEVSRSIQLLQLRELRLMLICRYRLSLFNRVWERI